MSLSVKASFEHRGIKPEIRRFVSSEAEASNFARLRQKMHVVFGIPLEQKLDLYWKDEEGDDITVSSDEEWKIGLDAMKNSLLKVYIRKSSSEQVHSKSSIGRVPTTSGVIKHNSANEPNDFWSTSMSSPAPIMEFCYKINRMMFDNMAATDDAEFEHVQHTTPFFGDNSAIHDLPSLTQDQKFQAWTNPVFSVNRPEDGRDVAEEHHRELVNRILALSKLTMKTVSEKVRKESELKAGAKDRFEAGGHGTKYFEYVDGPHKTKQEGTPPSASKTTAAPQVPTESARDTGVTAQIASVKQEIEVKEDEALKDYAVLQKIRGADGCTSPIDNEWSYIVPTDCNSATASGDPAFAAKLSDDPQMLDDSHPDARVAQATKIMVSMGFQNEGGWMTRLLELNNGNINDLLSIINILKENTGGNIHGVCQIILSILDTNAGDEQKTLDFLQWVRDLRARK